MEIVNNKSTLTIHISKKHLKPVKRVLKVVNTILTVGIVGSGIGFIANFLYNLF